MARGKVKPDEECRLMAIQVRITHGEHADLKRQAQSNGQTLSDLARKRLGLKPVETDAAQPAMPSAH